MFAAMASRWSSSNWRYFGSFVAMSSSVAAPTRASGILRRGAVVERNRGLQRARGEIVVVALECARRGRERCGGQQLAARIFFGEHPAIVGRARQSHGRRRASGVFFGSNTTLSVMSAPSPRNTYWRSVGSMMPRYSRPSDLVAADHRQHAVLELLQHVGLAVGLVDLRDQRLLVDRWCCRSRRGTAPTRARGRRWCRPAIPRACPSRRRRASRRGSDSAPARPAGS